MSNFLLARFARSHCQSLHYRDCDSYCVWGEARQGRAFEKILEGVLAGRRTLYVLATSDVSKKKDVAENNFGHGLEIKICMSTCLLPQTLHTLFPTAYTIGMIEARRLCGSGPPGRPAKRRASAAEPVCLATSYVRNLFPDLVETFSRRCSRVKKSVCMSTSNVVNQCQFL